MDDIQVGPSYTFSHDDKELFLALVNLFHAVGNTIDRPDGGHEHWLKVAYDKIDDIARDKGE